VFHKRSLEKLLVERRNISFELELELLDEETFIRKAKIPNAFSMYCVIDRLSW